MPIDPFFLKNKEVGATSIIMVMIILTGMLFVVLSINSIVMNGINMSRSHIESTKAYFAAESGTEKILWYIRKFGSGTNKAFNPYIDAPSLWEDEKWVKFKADDSINHCKDNYGAANTFGELENGSQYAIQYFDVGSGASARFKTVGEFLGNTKRVVEVEYVY